MDSSVFLGASAGGSLETKVEVAALTCLRSWLTLSASEAADLLILPGNLQTTQVKPMLDTKASRVE